MAAANSESRGGTPISLIVVHTNEGDHKPGLADDHTAENLAGYLTRQCEAGHGISYHRIVDDDSVVRFVPDDRAAWAARSANRRGLHICLTGWARWSRTEWLQHRPMLTLASREIRAWSHAHRIPLVKLTPAQVGADARGVCGHGDWTIGKRDGTHTDPGPHFPWDVLLGESSPASPTRPTEEPAVQLPRTLPAGTGRPGPDWPATEEIVILSPGLVKIVFGNRGAWVQRAWWGERGQDIVSEPGRFVEQFKTQRWTAPDWVDYLTIRYAAPGGGSVGDG